MGLSFSLLILIIFTLISRVKLLFTLCILSGSMKAFVSSSIKNEFKIELPNELDSEEPMCPICKHQIRIGTSKFGNFSME